MLVIQKWIREHRNCGWSDHWCISTLDIGTSQGHIICNSSYLFSVWHKINFYILRVDSTLGKVTANCRFNFAMMRCVGMVLPDSYP